MSLRSRFRQNERERRDMTDTKEPVTELDARFSSDGALATPWEEGRRHLEEAGVYWLTTVRPDGRPHVTPLISVWLVDALYFCTGPEERKAHNLAANPRCAVTTGCSTLDDGLDLVVEGTTERITDQASLRNIADAFESKYGPEWRFTVNDETLTHTPESSRDDDPGSALVYRVAPVKVFGFRKGEYAQTCWRFDLLRVGEPSHQYG